MTVVTPSSSSVTTSGAVAGTTAIGSVSSTRSGEAIDISNLIVLLQKTNQALRDTLQKRSVSQMQNSYEMAVASVGQKQKAAAKTAHATMVNGIATLVGGVTGGGLGLMGIKGGNWKPISEAAVNILPAAGTAAGGFATMNVTQEASRLQIGADYINDSKNIYDKQSDVDSNAMRSYSQKMTETTRSLTDLYGAMLNATNWK